MIDIADYLLLTAFGTANSRIRGLALAFIAFGETKNALDLNRPSEGGAGFGSDKAFIRGVTVDERITE